MPLPAAGYSGACDVPRFPVQPPPNKHPANHLLTRPFIVCHLIVHSIAPTHPATLLTQPFDACHSNCPALQTVTEDLKKRFAVNGEPLIDESVVGSYHSRGSSPHISSHAVSIAASGSASFNRTTGFAVSQRPTLASSAPVAVVRPASAAGHHGLLSQHITAHGSAHQHPQQQHQQQAANGVYAYTNGHAAGSTVGSSGYEPPEPQPGGRSGGSTPPEDIPGARPPQPPSHHGGSRPSSKPGTPTALEAQVAKLVQSQNMLSNQLEELALQISLSQMPGSKQHQQKQQAAAAAAAAAAGAQWELPPVAWAVLGAAAGVAATLLIVRGGDRS